MDAKVLTQRRVRLFNIAREVALTSGGVGGNSGDCFRIGCIIVDGRGIVASGTNSYRTSPRLSRYYDYPFYHAEASAIFRVGFAGCVARDMYIARVLRDGSLAMARPCEECRELIAEAGIRRVYFSTGDGFERL